MVRYSWPAATPRNLRLPGITVQALIIAESEALGDALQAMLLTMRCVDTVRRVFDMASAFSLLNAQPADVVLVDGALCDAATAGRLEREWPETRLFILADTPQELPISRSQVVLKGMPARELFDAVERLLAEQRQPGA